MQERCNSIANALELRLYSTNPSIFGFDEFITKVEYCKVDQISNSED